MADGLGHCQDDQPEREADFKSADGTIMLMKKGQPPPDLKYFKQP
jgi:hypothetical protein